MPHQSLKATKHGIRRRLLSHERYFAAKLELQTPAGETVLVVGGCWDRLGRRYVDRPVVAKVVRLKKSQVEMGRAIAEYIRKRLAGDDSRAALLMAMGNRGGGKTFLCGGILMVAIALTLPFSWQMGVSITAKQNREIKQAIEMVAAPGWIANDVADFRDPYTEFITGSKILWLTSKNPKALRQALLPFEHILINEGQDQREVVFINAISAIRSGGVVSIATNPPQESAGDWVAVLYQGIESGSGEPPGAGGSQQINRGDGQVFELDAAQNDAVSQPTRGKISRLLRLVNPDAADADAEGIIKLSGNVGYPGFSRQVRRVGDDGAWIAGHVGERDISWVDVTAQITADHANSGSGFDYVGGGDFQTEPGSCAPVAKIYRAPSGQLILWIKEFVASQGTEQDLTYALSARGYFPGPVDWSGNPAASMLLVGDATGARQNAEHRKRDPYSFTRLKADGWTVLPPELYGPKRTPWNPLVSDSRKQMKRLFLEGAIVLSPQCADAFPGFPSLTESFVRAKVNSSGKFEKKGHYTHGPDGVRYLAWRFLPRSQPDVPRGIDKVTFDALRGIRVLSSG